MGVTYRRCPDGGRCWHGCADDVVCWRVNHCAPLSDYAEDWNRQGRARVSGLDDRSAGGPHHPAPADLATALGDLADAVAEALRLPKLVEWLARQLERFSVRTW